MLTQRQIISPPQPPTMRRIDIQRHIIQLQALNRKRDPLPIHGHRILAELHTHIRHGITQRIRLQHHRKAQVLGIRQLLRIRLDELLLVDPQPIVLAAQLARRLARRAISVGQVIQNQTDDLLLAGAALLLARRVDGLVDLRETGAGSDPDEGAGLLNLADYVGVGAVASVVEGAVGLLELGGPFGVGEELLAGEGVDVGGADLGGLRRAGRLGRTERGGGDGGTGGREGGEESEGAHHCDL